MPLIIKEIDIRELVLIFVFRGIDLFLSSDVNNSGCNTKNHLSHMSIDSLRANYLGLTVYYRQYLRVGLLVSIIVPGYNKKLQN